MPCGSTEFPPSRKTTSWPSMTARTDSRVVRWNTKSEPLSISVILPASSGPRIRSRVGTRVVRAGRVSTRTSGTTMASAARAMEILPANRWRWRYKVRGGGEVGESVMVNEMHVSPRSKSFLTAPTILERSRHARGAIPERDGDAPHRLGVRGHPAPREPPRVVVPLGARRGGPRGPPGGLPPGSGYRHEPSISGGRPGDVVLHATRLIEFGKLVAEHRRARNTRRPGTF